MGVSSLDQQFKIRSQSSSVIDDARVERERVFRLRADRPMHRPRDPWKMNAQVWNCFGFWNWTVLILLIMTIKMFLENMNKFGLQIDPSLWGTLIFGETGTCFRSAMAVFILVIFVNVPLIVALKLEVYLSQNIINWSTGLFFHCANIIVLLSMPVKLIYLTPSQIGLCSSVLIVTVYTCQFMKLVSYIQVNKWCRETRIDNRSLSKRRYTYNRHASVTSELEKSRSNLRRRFYRNSPDNKVDICHKDKVEKSPPKEAKNIEFVDLNNNVESVMEVTKNQPSAKREILQSPDKNKVRSSSKNEKISLNSDNCVRVDVVYPDNLTIRDIYYFLCVPTLCYEVNFPRTRRVRKLFLLNRALEVFVCSNLAICILQQYIIPSVLHTFLPFSNMELSLATERLLKLALPNHLLWLLMFYLIFHSFLNTSAEILQFADRSFFRDWWNAPNLEVFWKTWNLPVHRWCLRHVYKPMLSAGYSRTASMLVVFSLSALLHEYLVSVPLRMLNSGVFLGMLVQIPLVHITRKVEKKLGSKFGNMMVWASLIIGQPLIIMMYYHDYVIQHYGSQIGTLSEKYQC